MMQIDEHYEQNAGHASSLFSSRSQLTAKRNVSGSMRSATTRLEAFPSAIRKLIRFIHNSDTSPCFTQFIKVLRYTDHHLLPPPMTFEWEKLFSITTFYIG